MAQQVAAEIATDEAIHVTTARRADRERLAGMVLAEVKQRRR